MMKHPLVDQLLCVPVSLDALLEAVNNFQTLVEKSITQMFTVRM